MKDFAATPSRPPRRLSAFQPMPGSVGLRDLVALLTLAPLDANPTLCMVVSIKMDIDEILHGGGEVFSIGYRET